MILTAAAALTFLFYLSQALLSSSARHSALLSTARIACFMEGAEVRDSKEIQDLKNQTTKKCTSNKNNNKKHALHKHRKKKKTCCNKKATTQKLTKKHEQKRMNKQKIH